jgi:hypothetical protein
MDSFSGSVTPGKSIAAIAESYVLARKLVNANADRNNWQGRCCVIARPKGQVLACPDRYMRFFFLR